MPYITKKQYEDYLRLKELERETPSLDALRFVIKAYDYDPEKIGKHFLECYARMRKS